MIRSTLGNWFFSLIGGLVISVWSIAIAQDDPVLPGPTSTNQVKPDGQTEPAGKTPAAAITDADRMIRLETSIEADKKRLLELESELKKAQADEKVTSANVQQLAMQIEDKRKLLQNAVDAGDAIEIQKQQSELAELTAKHQLATDQLNLVIQTRKAGQAQIATLQQKIATDQESLDKLKGTPSSTPANVESSTPSAPATPSQSATPTDATLEKTAESTASERKALQQSSVSKDQAKARKSVEDKATSLQDIEEDLDAMAGSKSLLEKNIEFESEKLETARQKYDSLENSMAIAEKEFNDRLAAGAPAAELQQLRKQISDIQQKMRDARNDARRSTDRLQDLRGELLALQAEETHLVKQGEALRRELAAAKRSEWVLRARDYLYITVPKILIILALTFLVWMFLKLICRRSRIWIASAGTGDEAERVNRANTLAGVFQNTGNMVIVVGSLMMILDAAGVPIAALLGGAGVVGLAVAFGAQSLMKDYFCGFILLLEDQYKVNDFVTICGLSGVVEQITLRITILRDFEGKVYFIPNGQITSVTNATLDWSRAVLEIGVAYKENVDRVMREIEQLTARLREDPEYSEFILGDVEMLGVDSLGDSSVVIKFGVKTRPDKKWPVKRELLRRIKKTFDEQGIEIPFPHRTVIHRNENGNPARPVAEPVGGKANR